jgi:hypothetical protein
MSEHQAPGLCRTDLHAVRNAGSGNAAELATCVVEKASPLLMLAE